MTALAFQPAPRPASPPPAPPQPPADPPMGPGPSACRVRLAVYAVVYVATVSGGLWVWWRAGALAALLLVVLIFMFALTRTSNARRDPVPTGAPEWRARPTRRPVRRLLSPLGRTGHRDTGLHVAASPGG